MADAYGPVITRRLLVIKIYGGCLAASLVVMLFISSFTILCALYLLAVIGFIALLVTHYFLDPRATAWATHGYRP